MKDSLYQPTKERALFKLLPEEDLSIGNVSKEKKRGEEGRGGEGWGGDKQDSHLPVLRSHKEGWDGFCLRTNKDKMVLCDERDSLNQTSVRFLLATSQLGPMLAQFNKNPTKPV